MASLIVLAILGCYALLMAIERLAPGRRFRSVPWWRLRGVATFAIYLAFALYLPRLWDGLLAEHTLFDASGLGFAGGAVVGFLALELGIYLWHRALHRVPFLWRWFHQVHHSAERVDLAGAFYFSPLDLVGFNLISSLVLVGGIGIDANAAGAVAILATALAMFQHTNLRTPQWLGYIVQRPECHSVHHERGVHAYNYGDIALWDQLFGTWRNPREWNGEAGFFDGSTDLVAPMLVGIDVSALQAARRSGRNVIETRV